MDDAGTGWHDFELIERRLAPTQELVALPVARVLEFDVAFERVRGPEQVGDHRVIDDQLSRCEWIDPGRVAA